jgi:ferritin-like metal-binding protein YciE
MKEIRDLEQLFHHELRVLWSAEDLLITAMPEMIDHAKNIGLKNILRLHLAETTQHKTALEMICKQLGVHPGSDLNVGLMGLIEEGKKVMAKDASDEAMDAAIIACAQKIEHYEMSGYISAAHYADMLGYMAIAKRLRLTFEEERQADSKLNFLAKNIINIQTSAKPLSPLEISNHGIMD